MEFITCKLVFDVGIDMAGVGKLLSKYTKDFEIANFYGEKQIGGNKIAFAVVDIPHASLADIADDKLIKAVDSMKSYSKDYTSAEKHECGSGGG